jgi:hypothetical protein
MKKGDKQKVDIKIFIAAIVITALITFVVVTTVMALSKLSC